MIVQQLQKRFCFLLNGLIAIFQSICQEGMILDDNIHIGIRIADEIHRKDQIRQHFSVRCFQRRICEIRIARMHSFIVIGSGQSLSPGPSFYKIKYQLSALRMVDPGRMGSVCCHVIHIAGADKIGDAFPLTCIYIALAVTVPLHIRDILRAVRMDYFTLFQLIQIQIDRYGLIAGTIDQ